MYVCVCVKPYQVHAVLASSESVCLANYTQCCLWRSVILSHSHPNFNILVQCTHRHCSRTCSSTYMYSMLYIDAYVCVTHSERVLIGEKEREGKGGGRNLLNTSSLDRWNVNKLIELSTLSTRLAGIGAWTMCRSITVATLGLRYRYYFYLIL